MSLLYLGLLHVRFIAIAALVAPILAAKDVAEQFPALRRAERDPLENLVTRLRGFPKALIGTAVALASILLLLLYMPDRRPAKDIMPVEAVDFMIKNLDTSRVYNSDWFGGYLITQGIKTFVDGRNDQLFGRGFLTELYTSLNGSGGEFLGLLERFCVTAAIVRPNSRDAQRVERGSAWRGVYADEFAVVFERDARTENKDGCGGGGKSK